MNSRDSKERSVRFNKPYSYYCLMLVLSFAVTACAPATVTMVADTQPAVIVDRGSCHDAIKAVMQTMTGSDRIRLSPDLFRTESMVLLSNYKPSEVLRDEGHQFSEAADRRFLLHIHKGRCFISLVDEHHRLTATEELDACGCAPVP
jgi:hypothetical protein